MNRHATKSCYKRRRASMSSLSSSSMLLLAFGVTAPSSAVSGFSTLSPAPMLRPASFASPEAKFYSRRHYPAFHPSSFICGKSATTVTSSRKYKSQLFMSADTASAAAAVAAATAARKAALGANSQAAAVAANQAAAAADAGRGAVMMSSKIAVSIDRPLISDGLLTYSHTPASAASSSSSSSGSNIIASFRAMIAQALSTVWTKPVFRVALLVIVTGLTLSLLIKQQQENSTTDTSAPAEEEQGLEVEGESSTSSSSSSGSLKSTMSTLMRRIKGRFHRVMERFEPRQQDIGVPMPFMEANEGWGVCTLASRKRLGKSSFVQYDFDLPESDYVLPLDLGQQVSMCCLDNEGNVARGDFFPFAPNAKIKPGTFSVLLPNHKSPDKNIFAMGLDAANFARVAKNELKIGDEVALKPGKHRLAYRGQYLPVTDMIYVAFGTGIVPVLDQIRAVLPSGTSSVKSVSVVWINEATRDFDVTAAILEKEYFKYSQKLAVSCIVDDLHYKNVAENSEVNDAIPNFELGTMAVVAGPAELKDKAMLYLEERGYPRDTICVL